MTSKRDSWCFVLALAPDAKASTSLPCLAYVSLSTYCKIRSVSKFTAASRGSPCDSMAVLHNTAAAAVYKTAVQSDLTSSFHAPRQSLTVEPSQYDRSVEVEPSPSDSVPAVSHKNAVKAKHQKLTTSSYTANKPSTDCREHNKSDF